MPRLPKEPTPLEKTLAELENSPLFKKLQKAGIIKLAKGIYTIVRSLPSPGTKSSPKKEPTYSDRMEERRRMIEEARKL